jgi:hypothetical protein
VPFFEQNGYACVGGPYGNPFNGYMGVAVAWPRAGMAVQEVHGGYREAAPTPPPPADRRGWA